MGSERQDFDETGGIPREPVAGGGAIARQSYDDSKLWNCWGRDIGKTFVVEMR